MVWLFDELSRRGVYRATAVYIAIAWGGTEILAFLVEPFWSAAAAAVALVYAELGDETGARRILDRSLEMVDEQFVSPGYIAIVFANLGTDDQAFEWLERAVDASDSFIFNLDYPGWDPVRTDERFTASCGQLQMHCGIGSFL